MPASASARQYEHAACAWFRRGAIQQVVREELRQCAPELDRVGGRRGLLLAGCAGLPDALEGHRLHTLHAGHLDARGLAAPARGAEARWPLCSASLGLVHLLHALELAGDPVGLLGECARVLEPEGVLVVLAFNPASPFRLRWLGRGIRGLGRVEVSRMVRAAGLDVIGCRRVGVWWRAGEPAVVERTGLLPPLRSSFVLVARRREPGLTPLRLERRRVAIGAGAAPG